jgi:NitT/TauT family transport system substrate-binding protein
MTTRKKLIIIFSVLVAISAIIAVGFYRRSPANSNDGKQRKKVVINEAVRTLLYLPLYHAKEKGYFTDEGLDVDIVTAGTATNSFAAMVSGEADFSQADPMYVPISREKGGKTKVVAQVVARIAVWGLTKNNSVTEINQQTLKGKTIATQPRPMTAYTYAIKTIKDLGLTPDKDVKIIETQSPSEIIPFLNGQADFAFTLEPNASKAVSQGAKVVLSYPDILGDQIFTALMTTEDFIGKNPETVQSVVNAYQRALKDLRENPQNGITTAKIYFPQLEEDILKLAVERIINERVLPIDVRISEESWKKASEVRVQAGDLKQIVPLFEAVDSNFADKAILKYQTK